jgi:hypothetical protein
MYDDIKPASNGVLWRIFPGLQPVAMVQIMRWFPVIEHFIAVLDRGVECCESIGN